MATLVTQRVDRSALRFNQLSIISLLGLAFVLGQVWLVAFVGLVMAVGTLWPQAGLFKTVYGAVVKPRGWLRPDVVEDTAEAHLFAQGVGALFLAASVAALLAGAEVLGWTLAGLVIVLAAVNLWLGFCLGCFVYYQLARRGLRVRLPTWRG